jgi:hypothetical protein
MMTRRVLCFLLMGALVMLMASACSSRSEEEDAEPQLPVAAADTSETTTPADDDTTARTDDTTPAETTTPADEPAPATQADAPQPALASDTEQNAADAFVGAADALSSLQSYRYTTSFTFAGIEDGDVEAGSYEMSGTVVEPERQHIRWTSVAEEETFELIEIEGRMWIKEGGTWEEIPVVAARAMSSIALVFAPSAAWNGLYGELLPESNYVGEETVNGIPARHYTTTYQHLRRYWEGELQDATGDVWIADEGYPVRYSFTATGFDEEGDSGTVLWTMDLTDVNADLTIEPPL